MWKRKILAVGDYVERNAPVENAPDLNPDDLYFDFCSGNGSLSYTDSKFDSSCQTYERWRRLFSVSFFFFDFNSLVAKYINTVAFAEAFHVNSSLIGTWSPCENGCGSIYQHDGGGMAAVYNSIFNATSPSRLRILIYS